MPLDLLLNELLFRKCELCALSSDGPPNTSAFRVHDLVPVSSPSKVVGVDKWILGVTTAVRFQTYVLFNGCSVGKDALDLNVKQEPHGDNDAEGKAECKYGGKEGINRGEEEDVSVPERRDAPDQDNSSVQACRKNDGTVDAAHDGEKEEPNEVDVISVPNAVVDPWAVVVHLKDTSITFCAVVRARRLEPFAL